MEMITDELLAVELAGADKPEVVVYLRGKFANCRRFKEFALANLSKIRKKLREATDDETEEDMAAELKVAYLLSLDDRFTLEYEKYKSQSPRSPDLTATYLDACVFNVEVTRVRKSPKYEGRFDKWYNSVCERIRKTPSGLGFSLNVTSLTGDIEIMAKLEAGGDIIVAFCVQMIRDNDASLPHECPREYLVPGFDGLLRLTLVKPTHRGPSNSTALFGHCAPILTSGKEPEKFAGLALQKLTQFMPQMPNVLIFKIGSWALAYQDMQMGLDWVAEVFRQRNDAILKERLYRDSAELLPHWQSLSAVLYLAHGVCGAKHPNCLWANPDASHCLPSNVSRYLEDMK